jgi:hypothetical protein
VHRLSAGTDLEETLGALRDLVNRVARAPQRLVRAARAAAQQEQVGLGVLAALLGRPDDEDLCTRSWVRSPARHRRRAGSEVSGSRARGAQGAGRPGSPGGGRPDRCCR